MPAPLVAIAVSRNRMVANVSPGTSGFCKLTGQPPVSLCEPQARMLLCPNHMERSPLLPQVLKFMELNL